ncbi:aldehyde dehydrogenase family protein [Pseudohalioglobus sediminis]|uniref:Aldehyde dehydrogenase family protein n=1 Tax=Pseudohalioglobus sediminis TaxID=2606449 RepID=A0A5B0X365_9GAMM|nr:aldehyde dehydrogenase family protein [Pseudohalioglobus sediminis]KAA1192599.1 aldehyde dehydrogenase family protein [Pseudohalioglobus sediminis]
MPLTTHYESLYIGGSWVKPKGGEAYTVINPATEEAVGEVPVGTAADADAAIAAAREAFDHGPWPRMDWRERAVILQQFHDVLVARKDEIVQLCVAEAGSIIPVASIMQFDMALDGLQYYIDQIQRREFVIPSSVSAHTNWATGGETLGSTVKVYEPLGVSVGITAYNYPFFLNLAKLGPALASGCTFILKPAPQTPLEAMILGEIASEVGIPPGVFSIVTGGVDVGEKLTTDPRVDQISFTGSDKVGAIIQAQAAPSLKRVALELGGKSAMIVCEDADLEQAAFAGVVNFTNQCGQGCILQTRQLVHNSIKDQYIEMLKAMASQVKMGDPADPDTGMGPLISAAQRERVLAYIEQGKSDGNSLVYGGSIPPGLNRGFFVEPTIFDCPSNSTAIAQEEIFGPVVCVIGFDTEDEAIAIANDSQYGLSGGVFSQDPGRAYRIAMQMRTGGVLINGGGGRLNPSVPFGGYKRSGIGREYGEEGLNEYLEIKVIDFRAA